MDDSLYNSIVGELDEIEKQENFDRIVKKLHSLQRHLLLLGRQKKIFLSFASDVLALLQGEEQWKKLHATSPAEKDGFLKSFSVLKAEILKALDEL